MLGAPIYRIKQRIKGFKLINTIGSLGLIVMGLFITTEAIVNYGLNINDTENMTYIMLGFGLLASGAFSLIILFLLSKKILVFKKHLKIGRKIIALKEIRGVKFTGLQPSSILYKELEGMHIKCFDGKSYYLHDELYKNLHLLKQFLNDEFLHEDTTEIEINSRDAPYLCQNLTPKIYKDTLSLCCLICLIIACLCLITAFILPKFDFSIGLITLCASLLVFYLRAWVFYSFTLSNQYIQFSPKYRLKKTTSIPLKRIKEIAAFEHSTQDYVYGLLIITHDFKSYRIPLNGYSEKSNRQFFQMLKKLKLPLRKDYREIF